MRETEGFIYKVFKWYSEFNGQEEPPPAPIWRYYLCSTSSSTSGQFPMLLAVVVLMSTLAPPVDLYLPKFLRFSFKLMSVGLSHHRCTVAWPGLKRLLHLIRSACRVGSSWGLRIASFLERIIQASPILQWLVGSCPSQISCYARSSILGTATPGE
ncbi:uncharacterized protein LOC122289633 isoform X1 [Carya illinoinensis]|uniref:uncharacterized protein LOC122289633 isoform X1 n=1 Tax=Carya illinoinensis TaxID=32201 RepID=UPI001C728E0E|nr:uncharacterized protein LOC122289633 isoform X1 [Carya illinoinensis]